MNKNKIINPEIEKALLDMTKNPDFIEKIEEDDYVLSAGKTDLRTYHNDKTKKERPVAWIRNHNFTHRQWKRFLSHSPGENIEKRGRHYHISGIFICLSYYDEDDKTFL